jgi:hypothetical protein
MTDTPRDREEQVWLAATLKDPTRPAKTNTLELIMPAVLVHPQRERIVELLNTPGRFDLRPMQPSPDQDPDTFTPDDAKIQALVTEDDGETIISICTFPLSMWGRYVDIPDSPEGLEP